MSAFGTGSRVWIESGGRFNVVMRSSFGGFGRSGYSLENGIEGMHRFLRLKSVWLAIDPSQPDPVA